MWTFERQIKGTNKQNYEKQFWKQPIQIKYCPVIFSFIGGKSAFSLLIDVRQKASKCVFRIQVGENKAEITWIDECKREVAQKIDQANDRQTEKKGLAELLGRCLGARPPSQRC